MKNHSAIAIRTDGSVLITDYWGSLRSIDQPIVRKNPQEDSASIGIVQHGILFGEEIEGQGGSGAIYIHGCALRCSTCYQPEFFSEKATITVSVQELTELMIDYASRNVDAIEIIIAHYHPDVHEAIKRAKLAGVQQPFVYKFAGQLPTRTLDALHHDIDIFIPDFKGFHPERLKLQGIPEGFGRASLKTIQHLLAYTSKKVVLRYLYLPTFAGHEDDVQQLLQNIPCYDRLTFSFLTDYFELKEKRFFKAPVKLTHRIESICHSHGISFWRAP